jgi:myo-inositol-1-phosphate synthase
MSTESSFYPELTRKIAPAKGKLGVLIPGLGAVATTLIAGIFLLNKGLGKPYGSLTQLQRIRLGKRTNPRFTLIKELVPLADPSDLVFGGWDIFPENAYQTASNAGVLPADLLAQVRRELESMKPWPGVFEQDYVRNLHGTHVKTAPTKMHLAEAVMRDIEAFMGSHALQRVVMIWCGSTEVYSEPGPVHQTLDAFERGLKENAAEISPSMIYAYAALASGIPFANGAPNLSAEIPALVELANKRRVPVAGKDFKTGQTLMKTIVAPGLKARMLGLAGWFSTNILGNRDGEVLDDPQSFKTKEESKLSVLHTILQPDLYPDLYKDFTHVVRINYYPPRGDNKEGWDNIDIVGWMNYPMQIKINFLCRDSILAAPIVLDLALFSDFAHRAGMKGIQEWLSFYYKSPMVAPGLQPEHDLFIQQTKLKNTLRHLMGEDQITHLGLEYYA